MIQQLQEVFAVLGCCRLPLWEGNPFPIVVPTFRVELRTKVRRPTISDTWYLLALFYLCPLFPHCNSSWANLEHASRLETMAPHPTCACTQTHSYSTQRNPRPPQHTHTPEANTNIKTCQEKFSRSRKWLISVVELEGLTPFIVIDNMSKQVSFHSGK